MKYSFNTWAFSSYPNWLPAYPIEEVIRRLSVLGYDAVELGCTAPHAWPDFMDKQDRKALLSFVKAHNMVFSTLLPVTGVAAGANPASRQRPRARVDGKAPLRHLRPCGRSGVPSDPLRSRFFHLRDAQRGRVALGARVADRHRAARTAARHPPFDRADTLGRQPCRNAGRREGTARAERS